MSVPTMQADNRADEGRSWDRYRAIAALVLGTTFLVYLLTLLPIQPIFNSEGFIERSKQPLFSLAFFTSQRPFTTDFVFKLAGSDPYHAVVAQLVVSAVSWAFLGFVVSGCVRNRVTSALMLVLVSLAALSWNVAGWDWVMRSESLSLSLMACWLGALLLLLRKPSWLRLLGLTAITLLFSFTRDNLPLFLASVAGLFLILALRYRERLPKGMPRFAAAYLGIVLVIAVVQGITAQIGKRHVFPLLNVVFQRILPDGERREWFIDHGMPCNEQILKFENQWASSRDWEIFSGKPEYVAFMKWIEHSGKFTYARYLLTHPGYLLTLDESGGTWYGTDLYGSTKAPPDSLPVTVAEGVYCVGKWNLYAMAVVALAAFVWFVRKKLHPILALPAVLGLCFYLNLLFIFHADAMETARHTLMIPIANHVLLVFTVLLVVDKALQRRTPTD